MRHYVKTISLSILIITALLGCGYKLSNPIEKNPQIRKALQHLHHNICVESKHYSAFQRQLLASLQNQRWLAKPNREDCYHLTIQNESLSLPNQNNDISQAQNIDIIFSTTLTFDTPSHAHIFTKKFTVSRSILVNQGELISENNRLLSIQNTLHENAIQNVIFYLSTHAQLPHTTQQAPVKR